LMHRIVVKADPALDAEFPEKRPAYIRLTTKQGRTHTYDLDRARGEPEYPLEARHTITKFDQIAPSCLGDAASQILKKHVLEVARLDDASVMAQCMAKAFSSAPSRKGGNATAG